MVTFTCRDFTQDDLSIGHIDDPIPGLVYGGVIPVTGWALDFQGVFAVQVLVDGNFITQTTPFFPRPDVASEFPSYPNALDSGWLTFIDTTQLSNGIHQLSVIVVDNARPNGQGNTTFIGKLPITVENPIP